MIKKIKPLLLLFRNSNKPGIQTDRRRFLKNKLPRKQKSIEGPRVAKAWNLVTAAKQLSLKEKEDQGENSVIRILKIKQKPVTKSQNQVLEYQQKIMNYRASNQLHTRLLARLVSQFGGTLHKNLIDYLLEEDINKIPLKVDLCIQWLYNEYQMAIDQMTTLNRNIIDSDSNYNTCLCVILKMLTDPGRIDLLSLEGNNIFVHVVLRAPLITSEAWKEIQAFCIPQRGSSSCKDIKIVTNMLLELIKRRISSNYVKIAEICIGLCTQVSTDSRLNSNETGIDTQNSSKNMSKLRENIIVEMTTVYKKSPKQLKSIIEEKYLTSWLDYLRDDRPPMKLVQSEEDIEWNEELIIRILYYFLNIIYLNPGKLLMDLANIFANAASKDVQRSILRAIPMHVEKIGVNNPAIINLIKNCPPNAELLVVRIINILTEALLTEQPANDLEDANRENELMNLHHQHMQPFGTFLADPNNAKYANSAYNLSNTNSLTHVARKNIISQDLLREMTNLYRSKEPRDIRYLTPVMSFLSYGEIVDYLPQICALNENHIKDAICRISRSHHITTAELMVELNSLVTPDSSKEEIENAIQGIKVCFSERQIFSMDVMARALTKITELFEDDGKDESQGGRHRTPSQKQALARRKKRGQDLTAPPTLSMRTFIHAIMVYKKLWTLIIALLKRMIDSGKITKYSWLWEGFIKCCHKLKQNSYELILSLDSEHGWGHVSLNRNRYCLNQSNDA